MYTLACLAFPFLSACVCGLCMAMLSFFISSMLYKVTHFGFFSLLIRFS